MDPTLTVVDFNLTDTSSLDFGTFELILGQKIFHNS